MVAEHMRPEGLSQGYFCMRCGAGGLNMYGTGHGPGQCEPNAKLVSTLIRLNAPVRGNPRLYNDQIQPPVDHKNDTGGGRWIKRDADVHRCNKPGWSETVRTGDQWECNGCHTIWQCSVTPHYDPRPNESYTSLEWERVGKA